jgi:hypothetical protein
MSVWRIEMGCCGMPSDEGREEWQRGVFSRGRHCEGWCFWVRPSSDAKGQGKKAFVPLLWLQEGRLEFRGRSIHSRGSNSAAYERITASWGEVLKAID